MSNNNYQINEFGEIIREDYFFRTVRGTNAQLLPFNRKVWKIYLLSFFTFGLYGLVVAFAMAKETNIACVEDGKHTRGFWEVLGLSIITFGIYYVVWYVKWLNRESKYLANQGNEKSFKGSTYLWLMLLQVVINIIGSASSEISIICSILNIIIAIVILTKVITQHNAVCKIYNEVNNFVRKV